MFTPNSSGITAAVSGIVEMVVVAPGETISAGQPLAKVFSGEAANLKAQVDTKTAEAKVASLDYQRYQTLYRQGVIARQELDIARQRSLSADAALRAARAQAFAVGSPDTNGRLVITSPINGIVGRVPTSPGAFVSSTDVIAEVSDPTQSEFVFTVLPDLASQMKVGSELLVTSTATGNWIASVVGVMPNAIERSAYSLVRAQPKLKSPLLPPVGTPVSSTTVINRPENALTVPLNALQTLGEQTVVFALTEGGFRALPVLTGRQANGKVEILKGLSGSEHIAGTNAFLLKAELGKGEAGHAH